MLGVPPDERGPLRDWSLAILGALEPVLEARAVRSAGRRPSTEFKAYLRDLIDRRVREQRRRDGEILATLIAASDFAAPEVGTSG